MALPSQTERSSEMNRAVMGQKGEGGSRVLLVVFGLVILAGGIFLMTRKSTPTAPKGDEGMTPVVRDGKGDSGATVRPSQNNPGVSTPVTPDLLPPGQPTHGSTTQHPPGTIDGKPAEIVPTGQLSTGQLPESNPNANSLNPSGEPTPTTPAPTTAPMSGGTDPVATLVDAGERALSANKLVEARMLLSRALLMKDTPAATRAMIRSKLEGVNTDLVFSPKVHTGDPLAEAYKVQAGDALSRIPRKRELATDWRLIQSINKITNPAAIREGQTLKLLKGPFHAVVTKSEYRVDVYAGSPSEPATWLYIRSYRCGLGEENSTPVGNYIIKRNSKLENPTWVNPRTGEKFAADDPKNPIGEYWLGWQGQGESASNQGFGFHGTVEPDSIGSQKSMGCVRLGDADIKELFSLLVEDVSIVRVLP